MDVKNFLQQLKLLSEEKRLYKIIYNEFITWKIEEIEKILIDNDIKDIVDFILWIE